MSEHLDDIEPEIEAPAGSIWDQLRAEHQALSSEREPLELDIPGYSALVVRYGYVPIGRTEKTTQRLVKLRKPTAQAVEGAIATLLLACQEILVRRPSGLTSLSDEGQPPVCFDHRLAAGMGWPAGMRARDIVRKVFAENDYAIIEQAREVSAWMSGQREEVADDFLEG